MGKLYVIGVSSGNYEDLTIKAYNTLKDSDLIYCDEKMYQVLSKYLDNNKLIYNDYNSTRQRCINAIKSSEDKMVSIVGSGDTTIYGMASVVINLIEEIKPNLDFEIIPGISSFLSSSALLGCPITKDFAVISLSDNFDDIENIKNRIELIAQTNMIIVFLSPNPSNLEVAKEILLKYRNNNNLVGIVSNIGSDNQSITLTNIGNLNNTESLSTIIIGNNETELSNTMVRRLVTPLY